MASKMFVGSLACYRLGPVMLYLDIAVALGLPASTNLLLIYQQGVYGPFARLVDPLVS